VEKYTKILSLIFCTTSSGHFSPDMPLNLLWSLIICGWIRCKSYFLIKI